jgi:hypothetical protein
MGGPTVVVLGEEDAAELETAREYFERGGLADRVAFESGNAHETFSGVRGPLRHRVRRPPQGTLRRGSRQHAKS